MGKSDSNMRNDRSMEKRKPQHQNVFRRMCNKGCRGGGAALLWQGLGQ